MIETRFDGIKVIKTNWFLDEIVNVVLEKKDDYYFAYRAMPRYVKFPLGMVSAIHNECASIITITNGDSLPHFCGLRVCESASVQKLDDIEVF